MKLTKQQTAELQSLLDKSGVFDRMREALFEEFKRGELAERSRYKLTAIDDLQSELRRMEQ